MAVAAVAAAGPPGMVAPRPPFLPLPDAAYWRFRMQTAYGDDGGPAEPPTRCVDLPPMVSADGDRGAG